MWKDLANWRVEMAPHYETASRMLGVVENRILGPADRLLKRTACEVGVGRTLYPTHVGVFQAARGELPGQTMPDPFFGGEGPERTTCNECGGCMLGCRHGAKNTLDKNYLYLAEKYGTRVFAETKVIDIRPLEGVADGNNGYEVRTEDSLAFFNRHPRRFTCRGVVFSASALGTMELLFHLKDKGSLPTVSKQLGKYVRTNSESLIGVRVPCSKEGLSKGVTIGSGIRVDEHTDIQAVRYSEGSGAISLISTIMTGGRHGPGRIVLWLGNLARLFLLHPLRAMRILQPFRWATETVILLCMQALDSHIEMRWKRHIYWPFRKCLLSRGARIATFIPAANSFAQKCASMTGGAALSAIPEILFNVPTTAHIIGGCLIGSSPDSGVVDYRNRVFGYRNMYVCDGSVISANLGVNPSLTIAALTERAISFIPKACESKWDDAAITAAA